MSSVSLSPSLTFEGRRQCKLISSPNLIVAVYVSDGIRSYFVRLIVSLAGQMCRLDRLTQTDGCKIFTNPEISDFVLLLETLSLKILIILNFGHFVDDTVPTKHLFIEELNKWMNPVHTAPVTMWKNLSRCISHLHLSSVSGEQKKKLLCVFFHEGGFFGSDFQGAGERNSLWSLWNPFWLFQYSDKSYHSLSFSTVSTTD